MIVNTINTETTSAVIRYDFVRMADSRIAPPKNKRFSLTNVSGLLDDEEGCHDAKNLFLQFLVCKGRTIEGWRRDGKGHRVFRRYRLGACFKTGDFFKEKLGEAIVLRLIFEQSMLYFARALSDPRHNRPRACPMLFLW